MQPTTQPLANVARPATDAMAARLARQNRSGSGITGIVQGNGTPLLTNREQVVDELSDAEVGGAVQGPDPRALLKAMITGNDNVGRANATNRDFALEEPGITNRLRGQSMVRDFDRTQKRADVNSAAATQFDRDPARLRSMESDQAVALADIKNQGDYARAGSERYKADTDFDIAGINSAATADASDLEAIVRGYGDTVGGTALMADPAARDQAIAPIRALLMKLLQGQPNANQQP